MFIFLFPDHCLGERTKIPSTYEYFQWPRTAAGITARLACTNGKNFATRLCKAHPNKKPKWSNFQDSDCKSVDKRRDEGLTKIDEVNIFLFRFLIVINHH